MTIRAAIHADGGRSETKTRTDNRAFDVDVLAGAHNRRLAPAREAPLPEEARRAYPGYAIETNGPRETKGRWSILPPAPNGFCLISALSFALPNASVK